MKPTLTLIAWLFASLTASAAERPNVLLIMADELPAHFGLELPQLAKIVQN